MDEKRAKARFVSQKHGAEHRGIGWELTFDQWLEWWGSDLDRRGNGPLDLQMCRRGDAGPYSLGNIYKGTQKENAQTAGNLKRNRAADMAKQAHEAHLNALMWGASKDNYRDDEIDPDVVEIARLTGNLHVPNFTHAAFVTDKGR